ncbi:VOC family protein [Nitrospirillum viridazoti]
MSEGCGILMPLAAYPFSPRYAWLADRFGVLWQVSFSK